MNEPLHVRQIMVVEDHIRALKRIAFMLQREGFGVLQAENACAALGMLDTALPDLFILDMNMSELDGAELCRRIRNRPDVGGTPVLVLTTLGDPQGMEKALEAGASDCLSKPLVHHDLIVKVRSLLMQAQGEPTHGSNRVAPCSLEDLDHVP